MFGRGRRTQGLCMTALGRDPAAHPASTCFASAWWFLLLPLSACSVLRPMGESISTQYRSAPGAGAATVAGPPLEARAECLLVLLPGIGDEASTFERRGFVRDARRAGVPCDLALVSAHFTLVVVSIGFGR